MAALASALEDWLDILVEGGGSRKKNGEQQENLDHGGITLRLAQYAGVEQRGQDHGP